MRVLRPGDASSTIAFSAAEGIPGTGGTRGTHELVLGGIPSALRIRVWMRLTGVAETMARFPQHYSEMLCEGMAMADIDRAEIEQVCHGNGTVIDHVTVMER